MMETPPFSRYVNRKSTIQFFPPVSSSRDDLEVIDVMENASSSSSSRKKLKQIQVVPDIIDIDGDDDPVGLLFLGEKFSTDNKGKAARMGYDDSQVKDALAHQDMFPTSAVAESMNVISLNPLKSLATDLEDLGDLDDDDDGLSDYDIDEAYYEDDDDVFTSYDDTLSLQAQFDAVNLPPGLEAPITWLAYPASSQKKPASTSKVTASNQLSSCNGEEDEALKKFRLVKQFDTVQDFSDHYYIKKAVSKSKKAPPKWTKTIQQEWKILEKDLPDSIFVRVSEERMDLLRGVIIGAAGTPYHDGLFFFDVYFPSDYPDIPPQVYYHSGGLRLNPNLYACGKVCLSLLNTWSGNGTEKWIPGNSTMLQVLLSIQALVLNAKPYFNEPGYERMAGRKDGETAAQNYNESTFILSCKTMLYTLKRPPKHFEDFVVAHFRIRAHTILVACKAYIEGAQVGCVVGEGVQDVDEGDKSGSVSFKSSVGTMAGSLVPAFIQNGANNCEQFIPLGDGFRLTQANYTNILRSSFKPVEVVVGMSTNSNS